jgi:alkylhydroperoxidase family enzyme
VADGHLPDSLFDEARQELTETELADLTLAVSTINAWNRLCIAARLVPGTYQPTPRAVA